MEDEYQGERCKVVHCLEAIDSLNEALAHLPKKNKADSMRRRLVSYITRLADGGRMTEENFPKEGKLPKRPGQDNGHFHAIKKIPIRGYYWKSKKYPSTYFISHYVYKNYDDLLPKDITLVGKNWARIEENGDER